MMGDKMINLFGTMVVFVVILALLFGGLCSITGEEKKGGTIIGNCITAIILYAVILELFNVETIAGGVFESGLPLVNNVEKAGSVRQYFVSSPALFALDFVELVSLTLMINWVSNMFSFENAGFVGKITSRIVIVLGGIIAYGFFMDFVKDNVVIKWCVYCVECLITGGSILYTPLLMLSFITGLKKDNLFLTYIIKQFPSTSIGKAISTAITSSVIFLLLIIVLETQYGSICTMLKGTVDSLESWGSVFIMIIGIYVVVNSIKSKK
jgi:hypothetical protein